MTTFDHHIVAMQVPIVYTAEGDHDPDGMVFTLKAQEPLLKWLRARWSDRNEALPQLHRRAQRLRLLIDGLERLEPMLDQLRHGPNEDRDLLAELVQEEELPEYGEVEDRLRYGPRVRSPRSKAVRLHVQRTLDDIRVALSELDTDAALPQWNEPDPEVEPLAFRVVTRTPAQRATWRTHWTTQLEMVEQALRQLHKDLDEEPDPDTGHALNPATIAPGIPDAMVRRLMFNDHTAPAAGLGVDAPAYDRCNPLRPLPVLRPLVLRACQGDTIRLTVENQLPGRRVGFHVQGGGLGGVRVADGCHAGDNPDTTIAYGQQKSFQYSCEHEGVWPINDLADVRGSERGTNAHGLFGAIIVEPPGTTWHDPETGDDLTGLGYAGFLDVDVYAPGDPAATADDTVFHEFHDGVPRSFREFTVFMHDEPEIHSGLHTVGEHTVMPLSYRAEPMHNRLPHRMRELARRTPAHPPADQVGVDRTAVTWRLGPDLEEEFWTARTPEGRFLERVSGEEQHHSSWLFGEPVTHVQRAYAGDPCRVRLVHAGVKETHVYHLHVHQWRLIPQDTAPPSATGPGPRGSQLVDSVTIGPQHGMTIEPLYGSGSRQHAVGDIIWHCHLYPHFHHGMWGLWRSFDRLVDGSKALPDGTPCPPLKPLPGRSVPAPDDDLPGFPWFIDGDYPMKSPPPPAALPEHRVGRRLLLGMDLASEKEWAAMAHGCRDGSQPGALFVDLRAMAEAANEDAGLPSPRLVSYDVEVLATPMQYNVDGWHDPIGHHYRLRAATVKASDGAGGWHTVAEKPFEHPPGINPDPCYLRANHGDIVELRLHNSLTSFPADDFDVAMQPVECGLHVHLVKFDPLAADGSSTGWNYLSGASCREAVGSDQPGEQRTTSLHRWVVDEEFGPCFFHDHLLANYRQKHGLYAALLAEPPGSQWQDPEDQDRIAWSQPSAVVVSPPTTGVPPYREFALGVGDFVPLLDRGGRPLNPPSTLSGDDDPGAMAVNYRSAPLTHRGDDPSQWFSTSARSRVSMHGTQGDPDTPLLLAYPGERIRLRVIQGSHEEQHSFVMHGMRWRREWQNPNSPLMNQRSLGISEAFTFDIDPSGPSPFGPGDHLWRFAGIDDTWLGCWGYLRVLPPTEASFAILAPLADLDDDPAGARQQMTSARATPGKPERRTSGGFTKPVRTFVVVARRQEHLLAGPHLTDPWGLVWEHVRYRSDEHEIARESGRWPVPQTTGTAGPLVLRAHAGDWIRVIVVNEVLRPETDDEESEDEESAEEKWLVARRLPPFGVEPSPPRLPLEHLDELGRPDRRTVSPQVSLHPSLLLHDMANDGSNVGKNVDTTVPPAATGGGTHGGGGHTDLGNVVFRDGHDHEPVNWRELWWFADPALAPAAHEDGIGQVCLLEDFGDVRNHKHHGLVGALVVEPRDVSPYCRGSNAAQSDGWSGVEAELRDTEGNVVAREAVVFVQDGLRPFVNGHIDLPVPDVMPLDDPEDSGHKAINYRTAVVHAGRMPRSEAAPPLLRGGPGDRVWLRVVGAGDKPRQHTLTVHGGCWPEAPWLAGGPFAAAISGVVGGSAHDLDLTLAYQGDHTVRTGAFRWGTELGVIGLIRIAADS